jgi:tetratricopeptide (TPR) repeat protein
MAPWVTTVIARTYVLAALAAAAILVPVPARARLAEPLCDWLAGIATAAQAQADGKFAVAEGAARRALAARPRGVAAARASAALGLALLARDAPADAAEALETALASPMPARAYLAFARGDALSRAGGAPQAARLFAEATGGAPGLALAATARLRECEALLDAGLAGEALPALEALLREAPDEATGD